MHFQVLVNQMGMDFLQLIIKAMKLLCSMQLKLICTIKQGLVVQSLAEVVVVVAKAVDRNLDEVVSSTEAVAAKASAAGLAITHSSCTTVKFARSHVPVRRLTKTIWTDRNTKRRKWPSALVNLWYFFQLVIIGTYQHFLSFHYFRTLFRFLRLGQVLHFIANFATLHALLLTLTPLTFEAPSTKRLNISFLVPFHPRKFTNESVDLLQVVKLHTKLGKPIPPAEPQLIHASKSGSGAAASTSTATAATAATGSPVKVVVAGAPKINFLGGNYLTTSGSKPADTSTEIVAASTAAALSASPNSAPAAASQEKKDGDAPITAASATETAMSVVAQWEEERVIHPVGQDYVEELHGPDGKINGFNCRLCDCRFNDVNAKDMHLKGRRHR